MDRPLRAFHPAAIRLEGRILLVRVHVPLVAPPATEWTRLDRGDAGIAGEDLGAASEWGKPRPRSY